MDCLSSPKFQGKAPITPSDKMLSQAARHLGSPCRKEKDKSLSGTVLRLGTPDATPGKKVMKQAALTLRDNTASRWAKSLAGFLLRSQQGKQGKEVQEPSVEKADTQTDHSANDKSSIPHYVQVANEIGKLLEPPVVVPKQGFSSDSEAYAELYRLDTIWHAQRVAQELAPSETVSVPTSLSTKEAYQEFARLNSICSSKFTPEEREQHIDTAYKVRFPNYKRQEARSQASGKYANGHF